MTSMLMACRPRVPRETRFGNPDGSSGLAYADTTAVMNPSMGNPGSRMILFVATLNSTIPTPTGDWTKVYESTGIGNVGQNIAGSPTNGVKMAVFTKLMGNRYEETRVPASTTQTTTRMFGVYDCDIESIVGVEGLYGNGQFPAVTTQGPNRRVFQVMMTAGVTPRTANGQVGLFDYGHLDQATGTSNGPVYYAQGIAGAAGAVTPATFTLRDSANISATGNLSMVTIVLKPATHSGQEVTAVLWQAATSTWTVPANVYEIKQVVTIGSGGKGGNGNGVGTIPSGGGAGGKATRTQSIAVTPGQVIAYRVPAGSSQLSCYFGPSGSPYCSANSGTNAVVGTKGVGGAGTVGDILETGGDGGMGTNAPNSNVGGSLVGEGQGGAAALWNGTTYSNPVVGGTPGGGGGGGRPGSTSYVGAAGGKGEIRITYVLP